LHRQALVTAATSGSAKFFLGTDSAPHPKGLKEHACGCAGCYTALACDGAVHAGIRSGDALDKLEQFASFNGPDFYNLPRNTDVITLRREEWQVPAELPLGEATVVPLNGGETMGWKFG
jgi:dihydroorotase